MSQDTQIITTKDPYDTLTKIALEKKIDFNSLDFVLLGFETSYTLPNAEPKNLEEKELTFFDDEANFLQEGLKIEQSYKIRIFEKKPDVLHGRIKLIANKDDSMLIVDIHLNGLEPYQDLPIRLLENIYKQMIRAKFFLGIRIFDFKKNLIAFLNDFKNKGKTKAKICISKGVKPKSVAKESLIYDYKIKVANALSPTHKISHIGVKEGELVLTHIKGGEGQMGRNLRLESLEFKKPEEQPIELVCSENLEAKTIGENKSMVKTQYFAKKSGLVSQNGANFDIENDLTLNSVNFKEVGAILAGLDNNVSINIRNTNELEEAVGSGVIIECENLTINGTIGGNTKLNAKDIKVYGTSNAKSKIIAKSAYIAMHRGELECEEANIDNVENGKITATTAKIKKSVGGTIKAKNAEILTLMSNNTIYFSNVAYTEQFSGSNNKFVVKEHSLGESLETRLSVLLERKKVLPKLIAALKQSIAVSKSGVDMLSQKIEELKASKAKIPPNYEQIVQSYKEKQAELNALCEEEKQVHIEEQDIEAKLKLNEEELLNAKLINKSGTWTDMNQLKFVFSFPKTELIYSSSKDDKFRCIAAARNYDKDAVIELVKKNEFDEKDLECFTRSKA